MEHLSLLELNKMIGEVLTKNLEPSYWVIAEIGEMRQNQTGHCYLELVEKEDNQIKAKSRATIWSYTYRNLSGWFEAITGQSLKSGMKILCNVTVQFHEVYGFSLNIRDIDAQFTLGERAKKRQEIIAALQADGVFDMNKELPLPVVPQRIAVISSESAAGYGDFLDQLSENIYGYHFDMQLFKATMQGDQAESSIINAMHQVNDHIEAFDLLVIIRGGGAALDLDCFDGYELGSHIAQFPLPVVTGIGHERDETIADLVAHTKMKTPTAVAEFLISGMRNFEIKIDENLAVLINSLNQAITEENSNVAQFTYKFQRSSRELLHKENLNIVNIVHSLKSTYQNACKQQEQKLMETGHLLRKSPANIVNINNERLNHLQKELQVLDPKHVLNRGYTITLIEGKNINKISKLEKDSILTTLTQASEITSRLLYSKNK